MSADLKIVDGPFLGVENTIHADTFGDEVDWF
jgi:hypothetical protein